MSAGRIRFCFDFLSPYAYLAWHGIKPLCDRHDVELEPWPTLFPALLDHHGQRGPAEIPAKRVYMFKDAFRSAHALGRPLAPPPSHPFRPLLPLRACSLVEGEVQRRLIDRLFDVAWGGERHEEGGAEAPAVVARLADEVGVGADLVERAATPAAKERLRRQTAAAIEAGAFGVPTLLASRGGEPEELFWGYDSLGHVERFLEGQDPLERGAVERWAGLASSAVRPKSVAGTQGSGS